MRRVAAVREIALLLRLERQWIAQRMLVAHESARLPVNAAKHSHFVRSPKA